jgi:hypothetical protein
MTDDVDQPGPRSDRPAAATSNRPGEGNDTFDVLGTQIAALLRSTHEFSVRTRSEAETQARARLAEAEQQAQASLATAAERLAEADRRYTAATTLLAEATERAERLEQQARRWAAESQAAVDELAALRQPPRPGEADTLIDLRDGESTTSVPAADRDTDQVAPATIKRMRKGKGKHKRRRQTDRADLPLVAASVPAEEPTAPARQVAEFGS